jgi:rubredoxin
MSEYKKYVCVVCGFIYDEKLGDPENDIPPGTRWADVPDDWVCPDCGAAKVDFDLMVI